MNRPKVEEGCSEINQEVSGSGDGSWNQEVVFCRGDFSGSDGGYSDILKIEP